MTMLEIGRHARRAFHESFGPWKLTNLIDGTGPLIVRVGDTIGEMGLYLRLTEIAFGKEREADEG
ncbi:hypothetical protein ACC731_37715, partial [Rhizobium ruizarguesonis]